ncbi:MAG: dihydrolipoamide acetyltransferase family protein [Gemmataceae bacterium]
MPVDITLPDLGENISEGGVLEVKVKPGDVVKQGDIVVVIEAEKSTVEVPAGIEGKITEVVAKKGQKVKSGAVLARADAGANGAPAPPPKAAEPPKPAKAAEKPAEPARPAKTVDKSPDSARAPAPSGRNGEPTPRISPDKFVAAGPATRRLARKLGVDLTGVPGSGPRGRVLQEDVIAFAQRGGAGTSISPSLPDFSKWGPVEVQPLEMVRRKIAEQMSLSWHQVPHVTQNDLADITDLEAFRRSQEGNGPKLTVTAFAMKACAVALQEFPQFNASLDVAKGELVFKKYLHIGVAVDTEYGLLVPVIRDVDRKPVRQLAAELTEVAERARQRKLGIEEMRGSTFTVSNLGGIGGTSFTPIVNYPDVAILGLSRSRLQPTVLNGQIVPRLQLPLSLSYDHRVIDGADGARFCRRVASMLENVMLLAVEA